MFRWSDPPYMLVLDSSMILACLDNKHVSQMVDVSQIREDCSWTAYVPSDGSAERLPVATVMFVGSPYPDPSFLPDLGARTPSLGALSCAASRGGSASV